MVEARIQCLPDYIEEQRPLPDRQDSLDFLTHNLFDGADWFGDDDMTDDHGHISMDEAATEAEIDSGAEDGTALKARRKSDRRASSLNPH